MGWTIQHDVIIGELSLVIGILAYIGRALHKAGIKMTMDIRIWKNGKDKAE